MLFLIAVLTISAPPIPPPHASVFLSVREYPSIIREDKVDGVNGGKQIKLEVFLSQEKPKVELICFGVEWCRPCKRMKPIIGRLREDNWEVYYNDVNETRGARWTKYCRQNSKSVPYTLILVDDKPWEHVTGERNQEWLVDWLHRAENAWCIEHSQESVSFVKRLR